MIRAIIFFVVWLLAAICHAEQKTTTDCSKLPKSIKNSNQNEEKWDRNSTKAVLYSFHAQHFFKMIAYIKMNTTVPYFRAPQSCCRFPEPFQNPILDECYILHNDIGQCFVECLFNRSGICRQGKCSYQRAIDYLDREFALQQSAFKEIYKRAFKKCIAKANDVLGNMVKRFSRHGCHPLPEIIRFCVRNEMFTSCPNGYWNDRVAGCSKKRDFIRNCIKEN